MYQIGDFVMYGSTGACRITDISNTSLPGDKKKELYYKKVPVFQKKRPKPLLIPFRL